MSTEGSKTDLLSSSEDNTVSEDLQSSQSIIAVVKDFSNAGLVASEATSVGEALALDETTSGAVSNADNQIARESTDSVKTNPKEESSDAFIATSANEESGDSGTSFLENGQQRRKVSFAAPVCEDNGETAEAGTSTPPTSVAGEAEHSTEYSIETYYCCPEHRGFIGYFRIKMMYFRQSKYLLPFQVALLAMPLASGFVGAENMYRCPASPAVAILFFMMGIIGTAFLCGRIFTGFKKTLFPDSTWEDPSEGLPIAGVILLGLLFTTELACFFSMEPEFSLTRSSSKFCDAKFYYFATWMNYLGIALTILISLLHCPGMRPCCSSNYIPHVTHELIAG